MLEVLSLYTTPIVIGAGAILLVLSQLILTLIKWRRRYQYFQQFPQPEEFHWLYGNLHKIPKDTPTRLLFHRKLMLQHPRFYVLWHGSFSPHFFVHHPETVKLVLKSSAPKPRGLGGTYEYAIPWLGEGLLISNGPKWARTRRLLTPAFHFEILKPYVDIYNEAADILIDKMQDACDKNQSFELFSNISLCTLDIILRCAFSFEAKVQEQGRTHPYVAAVNELSELWLQRARSPWLHSDAVYTRTSGGRTFDTHCQYVHTVTEDLIKTRRETLEKEGLPKTRCLDFLDILLTAKDENGSGLSLEEIRSEADTFLFEGHDTTASGISWVLYCLATHPDILKQAQEEIDAAVGAEKIKWEDLPKLSFLTQCIKEGMRLYTPVPFIQRQLEQETEVDGHILPVGTRVTIHLYNLHHNPHVWQDVDEFKPERFDRNENTKMDSFAFVPFSAGSRNCIGQNFALNEEKVVIARILQKFDITPDPSVKVRTKLSAVLRTENGIKIFLKRR